MTLLCREREPMSKSSLYFGIRLAIYTGLALAASVLTKGLVDDTILKNTLGVLQNISAAVFTLSGLWIAIIYPEAIKSYTSNKVQLIKGTVHTKRVESLILGVSTSAFVLLSIVVFTLLKPVLDKTNIFGSYSGYIDYFFLFYFYLINILQIKALLGILINGMLFALELYRKAEDAQRNEDM